MISDPDPPTPRQIPDAHFYDDEWLDYSLLIVALGFFVFLLML